MRGTFDPEDPRRTGHALCMATTEWSGSPWGGGVRCRRLREGECWERFAHADIRIAAHVMDGREAIPVPHVVENGGLLFATASGGSPDEGDAHGLMTVQIDGYDATEAFSVALIGYADEPTPEDGASLRRDPTLRRSVDGRKWVRFVPLSIEGRIYTAVASADAGSTASSARRQGHRWVREAPARRRGSSPGPRTPA